MAVRELLRADGADVAKVTPSTPLALFTGRYVSTFFERIALLRLGTLSPVEVVSRPAQVTFGFTVTGMVLLLVAGQIFSKPWMVIVAGVMMGGLYAAPLLLGSLFPPTSVSFKGLVTFRDLAMHLTRGDDDFADCQNDVRSASWR